jgi:hypothetical protein
MILSPVFNMNEETLIRLYENKNLVVVLTHREQPMNKPTHYMLVSDYSDSYTMLRQGYKETHRPFDLTDFPIAKAFYEAMDARLKRIDTLNDQILTGVKS